MKWLDSRGGRKGMTLCCVVQSDNFRSIPKLAELTTEWGVKLNLSGYTPLRTSDTEYMLTGDQVDEWEEITHQLVARRRKYADIRSSAYALAKMVEYYRAGKMPNCRTGYRFFNVNPNGTMSPCGLIIKNFETQRDLQDGFSKTNACERCFTSMRANCEKPARYMIMDNLTAL
jgi:MoaA/NifB/PqqE/SkfB family radical SAM enzyme